MRIGVSACFFHADPLREIFKGKTLVYAEQSLLRWLMSEGDLAYLIAPPPDAVPLERVVADLDGLVLAGGSDVCPLTYGQEPLRPEWSGDRIRDAFEIALIRAFLKADKPILGVCRGAQILNVAFGGTLYQDIGTQLPAARVHRSWDVYDQLHHEIATTPGTRLAATCGPGGTVNSVHHQAVQELGPGLQVEARSVEDGVVEAIRWTGNGYALGVQWHPEFQEPGDRQLDARGLLREFLDEARRTEEAR
jgi:putative glutamine amidotransferase